MAHRGYGSNAITGCLCGMLALALASPVLVACSGGGTGQGEDPSVADSPGTGSPVATPDGGPGAPSETERPLAPGEIDLSRVSLTDDMIPPVPSLPESVTQDAVNKSLLAVVAKRIPGIPVESVELLGSKSDNLPDGNGTQLWASYLLRLGEGSDDLGIEVSCSSQVAPVAKVKDILRVDDTQSYDVRNGRYVMAGDASEDNQSQPSDQGATEDTGDSSSETSRPETEPEPLRNQINPDDPFTYYDDDGNLRPLTESTNPHVEKTLSHDDKGNPIWIYGTGDLG